MILYHTDYDKNKIRLGFVNWNGIQKGFFSESIVKICNSKNTELIERQYYKLDVALFSTFGRRRTIAHSSCPHKVFFTGENISNTAIFNALFQFSDHCARYTELQAGFDFTEACADKNYIRLPWWLINLFNAFDTKDDICKKLSLYSQEYVKTKFCALINRHDPSGTRLAIYNELMSSAKIGGRRIDCPGAFLHNDDTLLTRFKNDKQQYLQQYKFNICPENSVAQGYVTEKIFDALRAGCIPIYYGGSKDPEPGIINPKIILWFEPNGDNVKTLDEIERLNSDEKYYNNFMKQNVFLDTAVDKIYNMQQQYIEKMQIIVDKITEEKS
jgi:hypothetical protein